MIDSARWAENGKTIEVTLDDGRTLWVPDNMRNRHRVALAEWEAEGHSILDYVPQPSAPAQPDPLEERVTSLEERVTILEQTP